jgi:FKBP-type peptidyl-prolyl cis-trans isomerase
MTRLNKYLIAAGACLLLAAASAGGWWWHDSHKTKAVSQSERTDTDQGDAGSLQVNAGGANSLGQLPQSQSSASAGSGSGSSSGFTDAVNPAQLAQYDKYKDAPHALFGDIKVGEGTELTGGKTAAVYYKGWLTNGQVFDQSRANSDGTLQPFLFSLGAHSVIPGFEEAIFGMKVGGTRLLIVPPAVGYGAQAQGSIPPNSVLIFQIQLLQVQ